MTQDWKARVEEWRRDGWGYVLITSSGEVKLYQQFPSAELMAGGLAVLSLREPGCVVDVLGAIDSAGICVTVT
jgi:hypothetical protein